MKQQVIQYANSDNHITPAHSDGKPATLWYGRGWSRPLTDDEQFAIDVGVRRKRFFFFGKPSVVSRVFEFRHEPAATLMFLYEGKFYSPTDGLYHDFGSVPAIAEFMPSFTSLSTPSSFVLHDEGYRRRTDGTHSVRVSTDNGVTWSRCTVTKAFMDRMLRAGIQVERKNSKLSAGIIYRLLQAFGGRAWSRKRKGGDV